VLWYTFGVTHQVRMEDYPVGGACCPAGSGEGEMWEGVKACCVLPGTVRRGAFLFWCNLPSLARPLLAAVD
jgi:hypothetical protein